MVADNGQKIKLGSIYTFNFTACSLHISHSSLIPAKLRLGYQSRPKSITAFLSTITGDRSEHRLGCDRLFIQNGSSSISRSADVDVLHDHVHHPRFPAGRTSKYGHLVQTADPLIESKLRSSTIRKHTMPPLGSTLQTLLTSPPLSLPIRQRSRLNLKQPIPSQPLGQDIPNSRSGRENTSLFPEMRDG